MIQILLHPVNNQIAFKNYKNTVLKPVPVKKIISFIYDDELRAKIQNTTDIHIWGCKNVSRWNRIQRDDTALFCHKGLFIAKMNVTIKFINEEISNHLWKTPEWKYIYLGNNFEIIDFPMENFNDMVGYEKDFHGRKFDILPNANRQINAKKVLKAMGLEDRPNEPPEIEPKQFLSLEQVGSILNLDKSTVKKLIEEGDILAYKFDKYYRIDPADLHKFIFNHKV